MDAGEVHTALGVETTSCIIGTIRRSTAQAESIPTCINKYTE
jgi:hypothetical protein